MISPDSVTETGVTGEVASLLEAQAYLGLPADAGSPAGLNLILGAAHETVDGPDSETGFSYRQRSIIAQLRGDWPCDPVLLPPPVDPDSLEVTYATDGEDATLPASSVSHYREDGRDYLELGEEPDDFGGGRTISIEYDTEEVTPPDSIKVALLAVAAWLFTHRRSRLGPDAAQARDNPEIRRILRRHKIDRVFV